jgi:transcriptional regulator with XRE-family HTH domain
VGFYNIMDEHELSILVGKRLKEARENMGLTQTDVQKILNYKSKGTIPGHEKGDSIPRPEELWKLSEIYKVSIDWLMGRSNHPKLAWHENAMELTEDEKEILLARRAASDRDKEIGDHIYKTSNK